ncbi:MAG TPA: DUF2167 domain-containing protein [Longimicrobium sp.]
MLRLSSAAAALLLPASLLAQPAAPGEPEVDPFASIQWQDGPTTAQIGSESRLSVPKGCGFTNAAGARQFMIATENPPSGNELGVLLCDLSEADGDEWFVVFSFDESGYVKDDDAAELDADAILASMREGNEIGNREREKQGWATLTITGWAKAPYYDLKTNNLTWALSATSEGHGVVNHSVRLLGRGGVMHADLVVAPERLASTVPEFDRIIGTHAFVEGRRYSEWKPGDKVAEYGLTALVAGGAVAVAAKSGILAKLGKFIVIGIVAIGAWLKSLFSRKPKNGQGAE